ncbi:hypothetical protein NW756_002379 [Fusarium oxysporum]|nr:hypothetical protein NW756_002379 [Fusarium oxysporum]
MSTGGSQATQLANTLNLDRRFDILEVVGYRDQGVYSVGEEMVRPAAELSHL